MRKHLRDKLPVSVSKLFAVVYCYICDYTCAHEIFAEHHPNLIYLILLKYKSQKLQKI